jgi:hypothetical protein
MVSAKESHLCDGTPLDAFSRTQPVRLRIDDPAPRDWLLEQDWAEWDHQIERDAEDPKLDGLMKQALADHAAGKTRPLAHLTISLVPA